MDGRRGQVDLPNDGVCIMPAGATFTAWWDRPADMACLYFMPEALHKVTGEDHAGEPPEVFPTLSLQSPTVSRLIRALHQDAESGHPYGKMLGDSIFVALAGALTQDRRVMWERSYRSGVGDRRVRSALEYIHGHLTSPLDVGTIASAAETSPFHLTRSFRTTMGCSLWQYVLRQRVRVAAGLMKDRALTLAEVSAMSGFESYSAFAASFKSILGLAPARYRAAL